MCAGKGKEEEDVQEEGGVTSNGRGNDEVQGPSDEVHLCSGKQSDPPTVVSYSCA